MSRLTEYSSTYKPFSYPWAMEYAESHEKNPLGFLGG